MGDDAFEPVQNGDSIPLIAGPQGGYHLTLAVEATGFALQDDLVGDFDGLVNDVLVGQSDPFVAPTCNRRTRTQQAWGLRLVYDDVPANLDGVTTEITLTLQDRSGRTASGSASLVIDASP